MFIFFLFLFCLAEPPFLSTKGFHSGGVIPKNDELEPGLGLLIGSHSRFVCDTELLTRKKYGMFHKSGYHPCPAAMLISVVLVYVLLKRAQL